MVIFNHCAAPVLALPLQRQCAMIILFKDNANRAQWHYNNILIIKNKLSS